MSKKSSVLILVLHQCSRAVCFYSLAVLTKGTVEPAFLGRHYSSSVATKHSWMFTTE